MKYFDVSWADSESQMDEQARTFGPLLAWAINNKLISDHHYANSSDVIDRVRERATPSPHFFADLCYEFCDGKICDQDFCDLGNRFIQHYLSEGLRQFSEDYFGVVGENMPQSDSWDTYDQMASILDRRFEEWRTAEA